ncbi:MAG: NRDE family protein, partial [Deltaproteobacteria bacterium]|nr:NRDE family protein [Deltaproteobacteria bacterium]
MCLLAVMSRVRPDLPLVVAANRDELLARPAGGFGVLRAAAPRVLGGRDLAAGGTWLAVSEHGVVAGLTNRPLPGGPDPGRASRGYLPLRAAEEPTAQAAVEALVSEVASGAFNPCWLLIGDRRELYLLEVGESGPPRVERLPPGIHVLENRALAAASPKAARVRGALTPLASTPAGELPARLTALLADHEVDAAVPAAGVPGADGRPRPRETEAACVHLASAGTRAATLVLLGEEGRPRVLHAEGPACSGAPADREGAWAEPVLHDDLLRQELAVVAARPGLPPDPGLPDPWAAVALVLHRAVRPPGAEARLSLLWIQRAVNPHDPWSGQMGFPGGRGEAADGSAHATARRETVEELGLTLAPAAWLGALSEIRARNRTGLAPFKVSPHAFWLPELPELRPDAQEVAAAHSIPLAWLMDPARRTTLEWPVGDGVVELPAIDYEGRLLWGLSLRVLEDLLARVRGTPLGERV